jgi:hypothetical protein
VLNVLALVIVLALPAIVIALIAFLRRRDKPDSGKR